MVESKYCKDLIKAVDKLTFRELVIIASVVAEEESKRYSTPHYLEGIVADIAGAYKECLDEEGDEHED